MIIQFKDYDFLYADRHNDPSVNDDMFALAGRVVEIPDAAVEYNGAGYLRYGQWVWNSDWYDVIEPMYAKGAPLYNITYTLSDTNILSDTLKHFKMPENLQYIKIKSDRASDAVSYDMGDYSLDFYPDTASVPTIHVKFTDTTEYNLSNYFTYSLDNLIRVETATNTYVFGTRVQENKATEVIVNLVKAYKKLYESMQNIKGYIARSKSATEIYLHGETMVFGSVDASMGFSGNYALSHLISSRDDVSTSLRYLDLKGLLRVFSSLTNIDLQEFGVDNITKVGIEDINLDALKDDKDYFFMGNHNTFLRIPMSLKDTLIPDIPLHLCPLYGFYTAKSGSAPHPENVISPLVRSMFSLSSSNYGYSLSPSWGIRNISEADFITLFNKIKPYFSSTDTMANAVISILVGDDWLHPKEYEVQQRRNQGYAQFNLKVSGNKYEYNGRTFYADDSDIIQDYDYEDALMFFGVSDDLHLGVELEVDKGGESHYNASIMGGILGFKHAYFMHDGSLNDGFEMATMPMTLDYHMSLEQNYKDAFGILTHLDYKSHNTSTCGLHIHFDRSFLGRTKPAQNLKASYIALIMERNWEKFVEFSRRDYSRIDQWSKKLDLIKEIYADDSDEDAINKFANTYGDGDKYVALNTNHAKTYELRIFRGTLKPETFLATLQFVDNLVRVGKECPSLAKAQQITFSDIINYKPHTHLVDYITSRGILTRDYITYKGE